MKIRLIQTTYLQMTCKCEVCLLWVVEGGFVFGLLPEWLLLLPIWLSDWLWATGGRSWQDWMGESLPEGATLGAFSMFFISISSWWIHRSGGRRSFWLPFLLLAQWLARFLQTERYGHEGQRSTEKVSVFIGWLLYFSYSQLLTFIYNVFFFRRTCIFFGVLICRISL